eukprot:COSAG01_NODE_8654_length_2706_cov_17.270232_2_plen_143_part_00
MRVLYQLLSLALLVNAEQISQSLVVYYTGGALAGVMLLSGVLVYWLMSRVDNNRKSGAILVVVGGGAWQLVTSFWHRYWLHVLGLYAASAVFGFSYCYRHPLKDRGQAYLGSMLWLIALLLAYSYVPCHAQDIIPPRWSCSQ